jgi:hypothetical protein
MSALAALTPPFLVCAVVIAAIVAFLRHEMGRGREGRSGGPEDNSGLTATARDEPGDGAGSGADTPTSARSEG